MTPKRRKERFTSNCVPYACSSVPRSWKSLLAVRWDLPNFFYHFEYSKWVLSYQRTQRWCVTHQRSMLRSLPNQNDRWVLKVDLFSEFQIRTVLSLEPETSLFPSWEYATASTPSSCPANGPTTNSLLSISQMQNVASWEPEATWFPSDGENATE